MARTHAIERYRNLGVVSVSNTKTADFIDQLVKMAEAPASVEPLGGIPVRTIRWAGSTGQYAESRVNVIAIPAQNDSRLTADIYRRVVDCLGVIVPATSAIPPTVDENLQEYAVSGRPTIILVSDIDQPEAGFVDRLRLGTRGWGQKVLPLQFPIGAGADFKGVVDLVRMRTIRHVVSADGNGCQIEAVTPEVGELVAPWREKLLEAVCEGSEELTAKYMESGDLVPEEIIGGLRVRQLRGEIIPVLCGAVNWKVSLRHLLDVVIELLPSPVDIPPITGMDAQQQPQVRRSGDGEPFSALVLATVNDPMAGPLALLRVFSGTVATGGRLISSWKGIEGQVSRLVQFAGHRVEVPTIQAGDLAGIGGMAGLTPGDTLSDPAHRISLIAGEDVPLYMVRVEGIDQQRLAQSITGMDRELQVGWQPEAGPGCRLLGMSQAGLATAMAGLRTSGLSFVAGPIRANCRETLRSGGLVGQFKYERTIAGRAHYAHVGLRLDPLPLGSGLKLVNWISGGPGVLVPARYVPAIEKGILITANKGGKAGFPIEDVRITLFDGSYHDTDSSLDDFEVAAAGAFSAAIGSGDLMILEPLLKVGVVVSDANRGEVMEEAVSRRSKIVGMASEKTGTTLIDVEVPVIEWLGFEEAIRRRLPGVAFTSRNFQRFVEAPPQVAERLAKS